MSKLTEEQRKELEELEELLNRIPKQYDNPPTNRGPHKAAIQALQAYSDQKYGRESSGRSPKLRKQHTYNQDNGLFAARKEAIRRIHENDAVLDDQYNELDKTVVKETDFGKTEVKETDFEKTIVQPPRLGDTLRKPKNGGKTTRRRRPGLTRSGLTRSGLTRRGVRRTSNKRRHSTIWLKL